MSHSLGEGLACNLASLEPASTTIGILGATVAGNNCHQFAGRRGHAFPVILHARGICRICVSKNRKLLEEEIRDSSSSGICDLIVAITIDRYYAILDDNLFFMLIFLFKSSENILKNFIINLFIYNKEKTRREKNKRSLPLYKKKLFQSACTFHKCKKMIYF